MRVVPIFSCNSQESEYRMFPKRFNSSLHIFNSVWVMCKQEEKVINTLKETITCSLTICTSLISAFSGWNKYVRSYHHDGTSRIWRIHICHVHLPSPQKWPVSRSWSTAASNSQIASWQIIWLIWCWLPISARLPLPPPSVYQYQMLGDKGSQWHNRDLQNGLWFPQIPGIAGWCHWVDGNKSVYTIIAGWLGDAVNWEHLV